MSFTGKFDGTSGDSVRIRLDADTANVTAGGGGRGGDVLITDDEGRVTIQLDGGGGEGALLGGGGLGPLGPSAIVSINAGGQLAIRTPDGEHTVIELRARRQGAVSAGELSLGDGAGGQPVVLRAVQGDDASIAVGGASRAGWIVVRNDQDADAAFLSGHEGGGTLELRNDQGQSTVILRATEGDDNAVLRLGTMQRSGWVSLWSNEDRESVLLGAPAAGGRLELRDDAGNTTVLISARGGAGWFGGQGVDGDLLVLPKEATAHETDQAAVWIRGDTGDIILRNADCAEEFDVDPAPGVQDGAVVALNDEGGLCLADVPYDRRVAGVISGAGDLRPGIVLGRKPGATGRWPVALSGKVYCRTDAGYGAVNVGDLLTTSATPGHAMAARDCARAFGAVIGKAVAPLTHGRGLIPVLVALQ